MGGGVVVVAPPRPAPPRSPTSSESAGPSGGLHRPACDASAEWLLPPPPSHHPQYLNHAPPINSIMSSCTSVVLNKASNKDFGHSTILAKASKHKFDKNHENLLALMRRTQNPFDCRDTFDKNKSSCFFCEDTQTVQDLVICSNFF